MARVPGGGGTRLVLIGDYLEDDLPAARRAAAAHAASGGEVYAVHVVAAEELEPPAGLRIAVDPEDARVRRAMDARARVVYGTQFAAWRAELARAWRDVGAAYALVRADEPAARAVRRVVQGGAGQGVVGPGASA